LLYAFIHTNAKFCVANGENKGLRRALWIIHACNTEEETSGI